MESTVSDLLIANYHIPHSQILSINIDIPGKHSFSELEKIIKSRVQNIKLFH